MITSSWARSRRVAVKMFTRAGRGKIDVHVTNVFSNYTDDSISVPATASTTAAEIVRLVLEKCKRRDEPFCYQLQMMCYDKSSKLRESVQKIVLFYIARYLQGRVLACSFPLFFIR